MCVHSFAATKVEIRVLAGTIEIHPGSLPGYRWRYTRSGNLKSDGQSQIGHPLNFHKLKVSEHVSPMVMVRTCVTYNVAGKWVISVISEPYHRSRQYKNNTQVTRCSIYIVD